MMQPLQFGRMLREKRREKQMGVSQLAQLLRNVAGKSVSPSYITRIESYGEIPRPEIIIALAEILGGAPEDWLDQARQIKVFEYESSLKIKYEEAVGLFRARKAD